MKLPQPIAIAGGTGFIGSHIASQLRSRGADVLALGRRHNLRDELTARRCIQASGARTVFHLAARVGGIGANRAEPYSFWEDNLRMGMNVIQAAVDGRVEVLVLVGSVCAYPLEPPIPFREEDLWMGYPEPTNAPYGVAKRCLQTGLAAASYERDLRYAFPIPTNVYGPREHFDLDKSHVIPALIQKFDDAIRSGADEVVLWGTGKPTRDFLYVEDAARGIIACAEQVLRTGKDIDAVNLSTGVEISIRDLAEVIREATGYRGKLIWDSSKPDGQPRRLVSCERANRLLSWRPEVEFADGIQRMVKWYRSEKTGNR